MPSGQLMWLVGKFKAAVRVLCAALALLFALSACATVRPEPSARIADFVPEWRELHPGLYFVAGRIERPRLEFWAVRAELADGDIEIVVNAADGTGIIPAVTVSGFAKHYGCAVAMNAGPFSPVSDRIGEERTLTGIFVSDGIQVSPPNPRYDCLVFYDDRAAVLPQYGTDGKLSLVSIRHVVGGFYALLKDGLLTERSASGAKTRHPRSAAGVSAAGFLLYLLVIDGRRIGSIGATEQETALLLQALGASDGILMDGGGSSALALEEDGDVRLANRPVHGGLVGRERAVATCIGIRAVSRKE